MKNIQLIPARPQKGSNVTKTEVRKLRVAAYCRVSTETEGQASSYETQIQHYTEFIKSKPNWELIDIYADDGISATSTKNREDFNRMITDCESGRIDMIISKSISRFARNTVDCLNYIRKLKDMNIPVFFEKENINTMDTRGEVLLTIMASLAQQESESLSQNVKLGYQFRFQQGKAIVNTTNFWGYDKDNNGNLVINPEQAEIVKRIFREYLEGYSCKSICRHLEEDGILTMRGKTRWHESVIKQILGNEKYMGDLLLQKSYTSNFLDKKRVKNTGEMPQYYVENNHEPIISRETFMLVQSEIARRGSIVDNLGRKRGFSSKSCFTGITCCGNCGSNYNRIHWTYKVEKTVVWRCELRVKNGNACAGRTVKENTLKAGFIDAMNHIIENNTEYIKTIEHNLEEALKKTNSSEIYMIDEQLRNLEQELLERTHRRQNYDNIAEQILELRNQREKYLTDESASGEFQKRVDELKSVIRSQSDQITEFDDKLARRLLAKVTVNDGHMIYEFKSGVEIMVEK